MADRRPRLRGASSAASLPVALLLLASCGSGTTSSVGGLTTGVTELQPTEGPPERAVEASEPSRVRLALAPDPLWQWLEDSGTVAAWERSRNIRIEVTFPFDQFAAFAGGHADVVVINALDVPKFVEQPERDPVIIGKYTQDRSILAVRRTSRAENLEDLVERRIAVESSLASTLLWGLIAEARYGLDFRPGSADFDLVNVEPAGIADLVMRGDVDACICTPDFSVPYLASGRLRPLYGGASAAEIYAADGSDDPAESPITDAPGGLPIADAFVVDKEWHTRHPEAVDALLGLWEQGLEAWKLHKAQIIADYPHHFSVESDQEIAWMTDYVGRHDWIVGSVYISDEDSATHTRTFARMHNLGLLPTDAVEPEIDLSYSREISALEAILKPGSDGGSPEGDLDRLTTRLSTPGTGSGSGSGG